MIIENISEKECEEIGGEYINEGGRSVCKVLKLKEEAIPIVLENNRNKMFNSLMDLRFLMRHNKEELRKHGVFDYIWDATNSLTKAINDIDDARKNW